MESLTSLGKGLDLSSYRKQLDAERASRSLVYRKANRPSIAGFLGKQGKPSTATLITQQFPLLIPENAIAALDGRQTQKISEFSSNVMACFQSGARKYLQDIVKSEDVAIALINALNAENIPEPILVILMSTIAMLFPLSPNLDETYVDNGLLFTLLSFLSDITPEDLKSSDKLHDIVGAAIELIGVLIDSSRYARDSVLCLGIHFILIDYAKSEVTGRLTYAACNCIQRLFNGTEKVDSKVISACIFPLFDLLSISDHSSLSSILTSMFLMTSKCPSLIFDFYDTQAYEIVIQMLDDEDLAFSALPLIGNLCNALPNEVEKMLELDLFNKLLAMLHTKAVADVFWVFSNLIEAMPHIIIGLFPHGFFNSAIEMSSSEEASFEVKKEIIFFLSTIILFADADILVSFTTLNLLNEITDMLDCGVGMIVLRCLDVLHIFILNLEKGTLPSEFMASLETEELLEQLELLADGNHRLLSEKACYILSRIQVLHQ